MKAKLNFKGNKIEFEVEKAKGIKKFTGLMFKNSETKALLFENIKAIHSFFCPNFLAIWLDNKNKVIEFKIVKPWNPLILPKKAFNRLIEMPLNKRYSKVIKSFLEDRKKDLNTTSS